MYKVNYNYIIIVSSSAMSCTIIYNYMQDALAGISVTANFDRPENGLEALAQVIVPVLYYMH